MTLLTEKQHTYLGYVMLYGAVIGWVAVRAAYHLDWLSIEAVNQITNDTSWIALWYAAHVVVRQETIRDREGKE